MPNILNTYGTDITCILLITGHRKYCEHDKNCQGGYNIWHYERTKREVSKQILSQLDDLGSRQILVVRL